MKKMLLFLFCLNAIFYLADAQKFLNERDTVNGDWTEQRVILYDTPEADMMVRAGDIDNLGFGWPVGFDPFSGAITPSHGFPWAVDTTDVDGTDRIMVITSYVGSPPHGQDGYTNNTSRPENLPRPITLYYDLEGMTIESAILQMFVDDFQAPVWKANYFVTINGQNVPYIAEIINPLVQTGPVGKLITVSVADNHLPLLMSDSLSIFFDDTVTGAGDGYAIDFVKLLINPIELSYTGSIEGYVTSTSTGQPVPGAYVKSSSNATQTDNNGYYFLDDVPAGLVYLSAYKHGYDTSSLYVDLESEQTIQVDFELNELPVAGCDTMHYPLVGSKTYYIVDEPESGYVSGNNSYGDLAKADFFEWEGTGYVMKILFEFAVAINESGNDTEIMFAIWENPGSTVIPGEMIASQPMPLSTIINNVQNEEMTVVDFPFPVEVEGSFFAGLMLPDITGDTLALWTNEDGNTAPGIAWEMWNDETWYSFSDDDSWQLDISQAIFPVVCNETGMEEGDKSLDMLSVYPNPAAGILHTHITKKVPGTVTLTLMNSTGQVLEVFEKFVQGVYVFQMSLDNYPEGLYFLLLKDNDQIEIEKIIHH